MPGTQFSSTGALRGMLFIKQVIHEALQAVCVRPYVAGCKVNAVNIQLNFGGLLIP